MHGLSLVATSGDGCANRCATYWNAEATVSDSHDPTAGETDVEIRRVCSLLESIAQQYPDGSPEADAIAQAAEAFTLVRQHQALARAYRRLKAAQNGELSDEMIAKLRSVGIDPAELDDADF